MKARGWVTFLICNLLISLTSPNILSAINSGATSATFLLIDPGAQSSAMAGSLSAVYGRADAIYWNPAIIGTLNHVENSASYLRYLENITFGSILTYYPTRSAGGLGFRVSVLDSGSISRRDISGKVSDDYVIQDMVFAPTWGAMLTDTLAVGTSLKFLRQRVDTVSVSGFALDAGTLLSILDHRLSLGFALKDVGDKIKEKPLPSTGIVGLAYKPNKNLTISGQADYFFDNTMVGRIGTEYRIANAFPLRFGYQFSRKSSDQDGNVNFGAGIIIRKSLLLDYAYSVGNIISSTHRFSIAYRFGAPGADSTAKGSRSIGTLASNYTPPRTIAILPLSNETNDLEGPIIVRDLIRINLLRKGYTLLEAESVDRILKDSFGITDGGQLRVASAKQIGAALSADALVYAELRQFKLIPTGVYNERSASVKIALIKSVDESKLFEGEGKASDKTVELTTEGMLKAGLSAVGEKAFAKYLGHPLRSISASAVNKGLKKLPITPTGMKEFGGRTWDEIGSDEKCVTLSQMDSNLGDWTGTEIDVFSDAPVCYKPTGLTNFDSFFDKVNMFVADIRLASAVLYMRNSGKELASNGQPVSAAVDQILPMLIRTVEHGKQIFEEGQGLVSSAPSQFMGLNALKLPQILKNMKLSLQNLASALKEGKDILSELRGESSTTPDQNK